MTVPPTQDAMQKYVLIIEVVDEEKRVGSFCFDLGNIHPATFPSESPYQGLKIYISGSLENGFEFSPDGYELWIRFSKDHDGKWVTYLMDRPYTFYFKLREDRALTDLMTNKKFLGSSDEIDEFNRIKEFKRN